VTQPIPKQYNAFAYVINGEGLFGMEDNIKQNMVANTGQMVVFDKNGEEVTMRAATADDDGTTKSSSLDILLIGGIPLNEPVVRYGPFVMNTKEEVLQAIEDYRNGRLGKINF
jgi:redox-sensitive bicupin YhaK (pirin superfamily)